MGLFHSGKKPHSGTVAKERLETLLAAERLNCSPQALQMLKNDLTIAAGKYLMIEPDEISVTISQSVPVILTARIPLKRNEDSHVKTL
ncbi:MAG: cell division topological specificity factor MinE [Fusicatenibacter sp.]|nr:cell division topological specificity factor MinE [Lachnospiraceae bacterium]MDY2938293.1 cell division topological specificity factor MinE [Fusicatenibacter sp.]